MRFAFVLAVGASLAPAVVLPAGDAPGAGPVSVAPVFHQLVRFTLPAPFKTTYEKTSGGYYLREHIPAGETVDDWSQMITLTATRDLATDERATPEEFVHALARGFRSHCPDSFSSLELGTQSAGASTGYAAIVSCGHIEAGGKAHSEAAVMLTIKGSADYYTLQWTEHGPDAKGAVSIDKNHWTGLLGRLNPIRLCPLVPGEAAPYPSCR
ncbi:MAG TPA: hypothetical protein VEU54_05310 [Steroidobacteraceae bacterium]|jgi:hypothetical protein|nr:hypothetical protein [Steroidobacteraceae bacterium]